MSQPNNVNRLDVMDTVMMGTNELEKEIWVQGDTHPRFRRFSDGQLEWGAGSAAVDTNLYRSAADTLKTDDTLDVAALNVAGTAVLTGSDVDRLVKVKKIALTAADTAGGVFAFTPGVACYVERVIVNVTTQSGGACTLDIGVAANGTTLNDTLIDGLSVASAGIFDNIEDKGTNGKARQRLTSSQYVTASVASGASSGLVGFAYIHYVVI